LSSSPLNWDVDRWRRVLEAYRIDDRYVLDRARAEDRAMLASLVPAKSSNSSTAVAPEATAVEPCAAIVARTDGEQAVTDDNMGTEWRYGWGRE
jgi:spermidine synthase